MRIISLAHLSVLELTPPQVVACAADAGFGWCNLRLAPARENEAQHTMLGDSPMMRETLATMAATGVRVHDVEVVWLRQGLDLGRLEPVFAAAARLGARRMIAVSGESDPSRTADLLASAADAASPYGLALDLEVIVWTEVKDLATACAIVDLCGRANVGILLDALHLTRAGIAASEIAMLNASRLAYAQICDVPFAPPSDGDLVREARHDRLAPGEGGLELREFLTALPHDLPLSVEVPMSGPAGARPARERAMHLASATKRLLGVPQLRTQ